jgi:RNA polymerase sigma-70 factor (ECF subfamily)
VTLPAPISLGICAPKVEESLASAEQLARRCQAGCAVSFEQLVAMFQGRIFNFLMQIVGNEHDAQDLAQETFVKAYNSIQRYDPRFRFSTWLFTIAKNSAFSFRRAARPTEWIDPIADLLPMPTVESAVDGEWVWRAARTLKPRHFEALWLRYAEGFTIEESARIMNINQISLKVVLHRARNALARKLKTDRPNLY